jgi:hypothetical protein
VLKAEACDINLQNETGETALMVALEQVKGSQIAKLKKYVCVPHLATFLFCANVIPCFVKKLKS